MIATMLPSSLLAVALLLDPAALVAAQDNAAMTAGNMGDGTMNDANSPPTNADPPAYTGGTGTYKWSKNIYLDLAPLPAGFGDDGADILNAALEAFKPTFRDAFVECVESTPPTSGTAPVEVVRMAEPSFLVYQWGDSAVRRDVIPLPYQYPNESGNGFVQQIKYEVSDLTITDNGEVQQLKCVKYAFRDNNFKGFVQDAALAAPDSPTKDMLEKIGPVKVHKKSTFDENNPDTYDQVEVSGKINLDLGPLTEGYGPDEEAAVLAALNHPNNGIFPLLSEAWRSGIEAAVPGSHAYSAAHYVWNTEPGVCGPNECLSFIPGSYYTTGFPGGSLGAISVNNGQTPSLAVSTAKGNLVNQEEKANGVVSSTYEYKFWLQWWTPEEGYAGDLSADVDIDQLTADFINANKGAVVNAIKAADDTGYFTPINSGLLMAEPYEDPTMNGSVGSVVLDESKEPCGMKVEVGCILSFTAEDEAPLNCKDFKPETVDDCTQEVRYTYFAQSTEEVVLVTALRYRDGSYWEEEYGNPRPYSTSKWGTKLAIPTAGTPYTLDSWEGEIVNFCQSQSVDTKLEFITDGGSAGETCVRSAIYTLETSVWSDSTAPDQPQQSVSDCTLKTTLSCMIDLDGDGEEDIGCEDYDPTASGDPCTVQISYLHTMHNTAPLGGTNVTLLEVYRTRPNDGDTYDFFNMILGGSLTLQPMYQMTIKESPTIDFCDPAENEYVTTFHTVSSTDGGVTPCENVVQYFLDMMPKPSK